MPHIWQGLRSGEWLTVARLRGHSLILFGLAVLVFAGWIAVSDRLIDRNGQPIGTDFSNVYAAGSLTWQGRSADAHVPALQHAAEKAVFDGREVPFYGWHYPPFFFAVVVLVAAVSYVELKAAALALGSLLATPYVLDYDFVVLAIAIGFFARHGLRHGFRDCEISLLAAAWIVPLLSRIIAGVSHIPLGPLVELTFHAFALRRAAFDRAGIAVGAQGIAQA